MEFSHEICSKIMGSEGKVLGVALATDASFIKTEKGEEGIKQVEQIAKDCGWKFSYQEIKNLEWYPLGYRFLSLALAMKAFGWDGKDIRRMGYNAPKISVMIKYSLKFFVNLETFLKWAPGFWQEHYTLGEMYIEKVDREAREYIVAIKNFRVYFDERSGEWIDFFFAHYFEGYFEKTFQFVEPSAKVKMTKVSMNGEIVYQYICSW